MKEYKTIERVAGPLIFVKKTEPVAYGDLVEISLDDGGKKNRTSTRYQRRHGYCTVI